MLFAVFYTYFLVETDSCSEILYDPFSPSFEASILERSELRIQEDLAAEKDAEALKTQQQEKDLKAIEKQAANDTRIRNDARWLEETNKARDDAIAFEEQERQRIAREEEAEKKYLARLKEIQEERERLDALIVAPAKAAAAAEREIQYNKVRNNCEIVERRKIGSGPAWIEYDFYAHNEYYPTVEDEMREKKAINDFRWNGNRYTKNGYEYRFAPQKRFTHTDDWRCEHQSVHDKQAYEDDAPRRARVAWEEERPERERLARLKREEELKKRLKREEAEEERKAELIESYERRERFRNNRRSHNSNKSNMSSFDRTMAKGTKSALDGVLDGAEAVFTGVGRFLTRIGRRRLFEADSLEERRIREDNVHTHEILFVLGTLLFAIILFRIYRRK